jgi:hypothetical protein
MGAGLKGRHLCVQALVYLSMASRANASPSPLTLQVGEILGTGVVGITIVLPALVLQLRPHALIKPLVQLDPEPSVINRRCVVEVARHANQPSATSRAPAHPGSGSWVVEIPALAAHCSTGACHSSRQCRRRTLPSSVNCAASAHPNSWNTSVARR